MEELLDMLDSSVFTDEIKDKLKEEFDKAVKIGVDLELAKEKEEKEKEEDEDGENKENDGNEGNNGDDKDDLNLDDTVYTGDEAVLNTLTKKEIVEKAERYMNSEIAKITKKADEYGKYISEVYTKKADEYGKYIQESLSKNIDSYLDAVADTIVESYAKENNELKLKINKAETLVEGFESMLKSGGVYLKDIITESEKQQLEQARPDIKIELDKQISENSKLKAEILKLQKSNIINETIKDLTSTQKESIIGLSKHISTNNIEKFEKELKVICESVITGTSMSQIVAKDINKSINEKVTGVKPSINESKSKKDKIDTSVSHKAFF